MLIRLADADRERIGCPEWIEFEAGRVSVREAAQLQKHGYKSPADLWKAWVGQYKQDADGNDVVDYIDFDAWLAVVWIALYRAGVKVAYDELDFEVFDIDTKPSESERGVEAGKDPSTPETTSTG